MTQDSPVPYEPSPVPQLIYSCKQHKDLMFYGIMAFTFSLILGVIIFVGVLQIWISFVATLIPLVVLIVMLLFLIPKRLEVWSDSIKVIFFFFYFKRLTLPI